MWIPVVTLTVVALILLVLIAPLLKVIGVINWQWKVIFAPIWIPLTLALLWLSGWVLFWGFFIWMLTFVSK